MMQSSHKWMSSPTIYKGKILNLVTQSLSSWVFMKHTSIPWVAGMGSTKSYKVSSLIMQSSKLHPISSCASKHTAPPGQCLRSASARKAHGQGSYPSHYHLHSHLADKTSQVVLLLSSCRQETHPTDNCGAVGSCQGRFPGKGIQHPQAFRMGTGNGIIPIKILHLPFC